MVSLLLRALLVIPAVSLVPHHGALVVAVDVLRDHPAAIEDVVVVVKVNPNFVSN